MSDAGKTKPLAGKGVVVTRPAQQAARLAGLIRAAGGEPLLFPVIEIADIEDPQPLFALIDRLDEFAWAIFVSPNAVNKAFAVIRQRRTVPPQLRFAAVGRGSVRELHRFGVASVVAPERFDSEALLAMPELANVGGKQVLIFRGTGGRDLMGDELSARGASVEYAACYRRARPGADPAPLLEAWGRHALHAVTVTSSEGLRNLWDLVGASGRQRLAQTPLFAPHPRIADAARELGMATVVPTAQGDEGLLAGLQHWFAAHP